MPTNEIWKPIPGYEGLYEISNKGRVKSLPRKGTCSHEKILKQSISKDGYNLVGLTKNSICKTKTVHRLVYSVFNGPIPKRLEVNHIDDENKQDNTLENLNLMTRSQNINYGNRNKKVAAKLKNGPCSKPIVQFDKQGNFIQEFPSISEGIRQYGRAICDNLYGKRKTAFGFIWKFKQQ